MVLLVRLSVLYLFVLMRFLFYIYFIDSHQTLILAYCFFDFFEICGKSFVTSLDNKVCFLMFPYDYCVREIYLSATERNQGMRMWKVLWTLFVFRIVKPNFVNLSDTFDTETKQVFSSFSSKSLGESQNLKASIHQRIQYCTS